MRRPRGRRSGPWAPDISNGFFRRSGTCIQRGDGATGADNEIIGTFMATSSQKVALVTGAARGIGLATARRFLAEGWRVALLDIERELLNEAVAGLKQAESTLALP